MQPINFLGTQLLHFTDPE